MWVVNGWGGVVNVERFKLGHFLQTSQPILERRHLLRRRRPYLEGLQAFEERRLPSDTAAVKVKVRELVCGSVEKGIRDDEL